ncbi:MAG: hypothetical protein HY515_02145 [Candidatus Aenigmarchaeota archaeon]|nr:hypothetical protein [Candidatus Aenigmarchaeota archaeon]
MDVASTWYWFLIICVFLMSLVILHTRSMRFLNFMFFGSAVGFVFDATAISLSFYNYNPAIDSVIISGVPLTVTFAEGVGMSVIIFIFESLWRKN